MGIYFLIGVLYALINGMIRKIDTDGDWLLPIVWMTLWPLCFIGLIFATLQNIFYRKNFK